MAFMRRARRFTRAKKDYTWSAVNTNLDTVVAGVQEQLVVLTAADWSAIAGTDRGTLLRIRGSVAVHQITALAALSQARWAIYVRDAGETDPNIESVTTYVDEDVLAYGVYVFRASAISGDPWLIDVDVKAKRKITNDTNVMFALRALGNDFVYSATIRALVNKL